MEDWAFDLFPDFVSARAYCSPELLPSRLSWPMGPVGDFLNQAPGFANWQKMNADQIKQVCAKTKKSLNFLGIAVLAKYGWTLSPYVIKR